MLDDVGLAGPLETRLRDSRDQLSPQEQRAADYMIEHLEEMPLYNATELARASGVSKATMSRLYRRLGFTDSNDVREHLRQRRRAGSPVDVSDPGAAGGSFNNLEAQLEQEIWNLRTLYSTLAAVDVAGVAALIAAAPRVLVMGFRNSYPVALHLRQQLLQARDLVHLAPQPGQTLSEELVGLAPSDVVIIVGFRRRSAELTRALAALSQSEATSVLLIDSGASASSFMADVVIRCPVETNSAFDSYSAAMSFVGVLSAAVLAAGGEEAESRVSRIDRMYAELGELDLG